MGFFSNLFGKKKEKKEEVITSPMGPQLTTDMHAHFLPGIDDGAQNMDESIDIIKTLHGFGYTHLVATPHVMSDFFKNTPKIILGKLEEVRTEVEKQGINIKIDAAAEYYLDDAFMRKLRNDEPLLTFGDAKYLLIETSFINPCVFIDEAIFLAISKGYQPIIAHPERYTYAYGKYDEILRWKELGALLQINALSLAGYYSSTAKKYAERLINDQAVDFIGTDTHKAKHLNWLEKVRNLSYYNKSLGLSLRNNTISEIPQK